MGTRKEIFGIAADSNDIYFAFEAQHTPYQKYVVGTLPRTDLVIQKESTGQGIADYGALVAYQAK